MHRCVVGNVLSEGFVRSPRFGQKKSQSCSIVSRNTTTFVCEPVLPMWPSFRRDIIGRHVMLPDFENTAARIWREAGGKVRTTVVPDLVLVCGGQVWRAQARGRGGRTAPPSSPSKEPSWLGGTTFVLPACGSGRGTQDTHSHCARSIHLEVARCQKEATWKLLMMEQGPSEHEVLGDSDNFECGMLRNLRL